MNQTMKSDLLRALGRQWLTPQDALRSVGCMSLAQRISEWRKQGYKFHQRTVRVNARTRVAAYRLKSKPKA